MLQKNCNLSESSISKIITALRRELGNKADWVSSLGKITFSLNHCTVRYNRNFLASPAYLFSGRKFSGLPLEHDIEMDTLKRDEQLRNTMLRLTRERLLEIPTLSANVAARRQEFETGQNVLTWSETILSKRIKGTADVRAKICSTWEVARILKRTGDLYLIQTENGKKRRVHFRKIKRIPEGFTTTYKNKTCTA